MMATIEANEWLESADCRNSKLFYPEIGLSVAVETRSHREAREEKAKQICAECIVRSECLNFALRAKLEGGIWGGLTDQERKNLAEAIEA